MSLRAMIVDDERLARKRLRELLGRHPEIVVVAEAEDLETARAAAEDAQPEVVFLDVDLGRGNGFELVPRLTRAPAIVFVTAHDAFAVEAFAVRAFDYLLKPVAAERLAQTVQRLLAGGAATAPLDLSAGAPRVLSLPDRLSLKDASTVRIVEVGRIAAVEAAGAYSRLLLRGLGAMTILRGISEWEQLLPPDYFVRLDRSLIVQLPLIRLVATVSRDRTLLSLDGVASPCEIGRAAAGRLRSRAPALFRPASGG